MVATSVIWGEGAGASVGLSKDSNALAIERLANLPPSTATAVALRMASSISKRAPTQGARYTARGISSTTDQCRIGDRVTARHGGSSWLALACASLAKPRWAITTSVSSSSLIRHWGGKANWSSTFCNAASCAGVMSARRVIAVVWGGWLRSMACVRSWATCLACRSNTACAWRTCSAANTTASTTRGATHHQIRRVRNFCSDMQSSLFL